MIIKLIHCSLALTRSRSPIKICLKVFSKVESSIGYCTCTATYAPLHRRGSITSLPSSVSDTCRRRRSGLISNSLFSCSIYLADELNPLNLKLDVDSTQHRHHCLSVKLVWRTLDYRSSLQAFPSTIVKIYFFSSSLPWFHMHDVRRICHQWHRNRYIYIYIYIYKLITVGL